MPSRNSSYVHQLYQSNIQILIDRFPTVFNRDNPLPLEIGVFEKLIALPNLGMGDEELECCLLCWTARREYVRSCHLLRTRTIINYSSLRSSMSSEWIQGLEPIDPETLRQYDERYASFQRRGML